MKNKPFFVAAVALAQVACSGDPSDTTSDLFADQLNRSTPFSAEAIVNSSQIGPEPNYWNCSLRRSGAAVSLDAEYQLFSDESGVFRIGPNYVTFSWQEAGAGPDYMDITNHTGNIPSERWFINSISPTVFSAKIDYALSHEALSSTIRDVSDASITCVLYASDEAVNPDDELMLGPLDDIPTNGGEGDNATIAQSIVNTNSAFGLENEIWECIAADGSLDRLLGFFPNGVGATYSTLNGQLERSQFSYSVEESDDVGTVSIDAVINNQAKRLQLSSLIVERSNQFLATYESPDLSNDVLVSCDRLPTSTISL